MATLGVTSQSTPRTTMGMMVGEVVKMALT